MKPTGNVIILILAGLAGVLSGPGRALCRADSSTFVEEFHVGETSWRIEGDRTTTRILEHERNSKSGTVAECIQVESATNTGRIQFEHALPPARRIEDLTLRVAVRANRNGLQVGLRVVLPHQLNPLTGEVLRTFVPGGRYTSANSWQWLECRTLDKQIQDRLVLMRAQFKLPDLDTRDMYVDQVILAAPLGIGVTEFFIDELRFGPIIPPRQNVPVVHANAEEDAGQRGARLILGQLHVNGVPFFPRFSRHCGEDPAALKQMGLNLIWTEEYDNSRLLQELRQHGLWAMATPPQAESAAGRILDASAASLVPFTEATAPILLWYLGSRIPADSKDQLISWIGQVRAADRRFDRPLLADVGGLERVYSTHVDMTGLSRPCLNTSFNFKQYRDWLIGRSKLAQPGSFLSTWIQTEPASSNVERRQLSGRTPIVVEPEQLRLQVYAALAAGYRGLGYWNTTRLDGDAPGARERRLALTQLNLEIELLEPWLSTATSGQQVPFQIEQPESANLSQRGLGFLTSPTSRHERNMLLADRDARLRRQDRIESELEAAILRSPRGLLLLPVWYEEGAQFVPGQMAANNVSIVVPGVAELASAWEITTTKIRNLQTERVTGGTLIKLGKLDQTAAIVLTSDRHAIAELESKMKTVAERSAQVCVALSQAKFERVESVDAELSSFGVGQPDAPHLLSTARELIRAAQSALGRGDFHEARQQSANAMQLLRILQRAHWEYAVAKLSSPVSSPHTVSFQTLPDHWRMIARLGRSSRRLDANLLRSGDFEDIDTMVVEGWRHEQQPVEGVYATAELYPAGHEGNYSLRLAAMPARGKDPPHVIPRSPVAVVTPSVQVRAGQVVHLSGWIKVVSPIVGHPDGVMLYDDLIGPAGALRWNDAGDWQPFQLIREVRQSGELSIRIVLNGLGEVHFDDLRIIPHDPRPRRTATESTSDDEESRPGALDFWQHWNKLKPLLPRN